MRAEKVIAYLLANDPGVAAIVGTKIWGGNAEDEIKAPLIIYSKIGAGRPDQADPAPLQLVEAVIEVLVIGSTYPECKELGEAVRVALLGKRGLIAGVDVQYVRIEDEGGDDFIPALREYTQPWQFRVTHTE